MPLTVIPQPISTTGLLRYVLAAPASVTLTITDPLGRIIARPLVDERQEIGLHELPLAVGELTPGVYVCSLTAGGVERVGRIVVVR